MDNFDRLTTMDKLPEKNSNYNRMEYWDQRYFQEESFEWCKSYAHFAHLIRKHVKPTDRILMLGKVYLRRTNTFIFVIVTIDCTCYILL